MTDLREPIANSLSNLAYAAAGIALHIYIGTTWWTSLISIGLLVLTVGSSMFHFQRRPDGSKSVLGGHMDEAGMFLTFLPLMFWSIYAVSGAHEWVWLGLAIGVGLLAASLAWKLDSHTLLGVVGAVAFPVMVLLDPMRAVIIGILLAAAFVVRGTGRPHGYNWPHAVWHLLTAIVVLLAAILLNANS